MITLKVGLAAAALLSSTVIAASEELEFLFTFGKAVSLLNTKAELPTGAKFDLNSIKAVLPGNDVRFFSVDEQYGTDNTLGPEGTAESAFIVSKNGRELLRVFSYGLEGEALKENPALASTHVVRIEAVAGVIDASGSTLGAPLNKAFRQGKIVCDAHEARACWSSQLPGIIYVPDQSGECDFFLYSNSTEFSAQLIPDCVDILGISLSG